MKVVKVLLAYSNSTCQYPLFKSSKVNQTAPSKHTIQGILNSLDAVGILDCQGVQLLQDNAKMKLSILFPDQHNCTGPGAVGWPYSSNTDHFLKVVFDLVTQPGQHPPIAFLNWPGTLLQGDLKFHNGGLVQVKIILSKDICIYFGLPLILGVTLSIP